jgi:YidC/Oxa1 family membrane protein insertase
MIHPINHYLISKGEKMGDNEKRTLFAIGLTMLLITAYSYFFMPAQKTEKKVGQQVTTQVSSKDSLTPAKSIKSSKINNEKTVAVETDNYILKISTNTGAIREFRLKQFKVNKKPVELVKSQGKYSTLETVFKDKTLEDIENSSAYVPNKLNFKLDSKNNKRTLILTKKKNDILITKKFTFYNDTYSIDYDINVVSSKNIKSKEFSIYAGPNLGDLEKSKYSHLGAVALVEDKKIRKDKKIDPKEDINWVALESKYFCFALLPANSKRITAGYANLDDNHYIYANLTTPTSLVIYGGPKSKQTIAAVDHNLDKIIRFGMFGFIGKPLLKVLNILYNYVGNYGIAIIILTFFIRLLFYPLSFKSYKSMKSMAKLQPKLKELQVKYKGKPELLNKATMELYKKHKVNPFGGCLPVVVQIPVFLALYNVLLNAIELRGAPFAFWIVDLSAKDPYYILPIFMGLTMFLQQKLTPSTMDPKQQKIMMFMPLIFTVMFLSFPSGLVVYWTTNNLLTILQQFIDSKIIQAKEQNV